MKKLKKIPAIATEAEEKTFWLAHDSTEYLDWGNAEKVRLSNFKA